MSTVVLASGGAGTEPPDTWIDVSVGDGPLLQRCLDIVRMMSKRYNAIDVDHRVRPWLAVDKGVIAYYRDGDDEIVLPYQFSQKHRMYEITSFGFLSNNVQGVVDLAVAKLRKIIASSGLSNTVFAGVPTEYDYPGMHQFLALVPVQPGVQVTVLPVASDFSMWRITV
jgi:hypothetical protein